MSDLISKQAVLDYVSQEANRDGGDFERWTIFAGKTISGDFDHPEQSEVHRLREALEVAQIHLMKDKPHFALMDIEDALSTQSEMVIE